MSSNYATEVRLFGKWSTDEVEIPDISVADYIPVKDKSAVFIPHTAGRYQVKRFRKATCPLVERLVCSLMMHGRNNGKKNYGYQHRETHFRTHPPHHRKQPRPSLRHRRHER